MFVKLVLDEPESDAVRAEVAKHELTSSRLLVAESRRAVARAGGPQRLVALDEELDGVAFLELTAGLIEVASRIGSPTLRTLDAIHLASAMRAPGVDLFLSLDSRLSSAAAQAGFRVVSPR